MWGLDGCRWWWLGLVEPYGEDDGMLQEGGVNPAIDGFRTGTGELNNILGRHPRSGAI